MKGNKRYFEWLFGTTLDRVTVDLVRRWTFQFAGGGALHVQCPWRLLKDQTLVLSSDDHGQRFGLPAPVDASSELLRLVGAQTIVAVTLIDRTSDIKIRFGAECELQVVPLSTGYEAWELLTPDGCYIVARGGEELTAFAR